MTDGDLVPAAPREAPGDGAEASRRTLRERAQALAKEPAKAKDASAFLEVVEFRLASERYAVESMWVREVFPLRDLTPLPCTPPFILGIINVRGEVFAVIDVRRLFDLPLGGLSDLNKAILLQSDEMQIGILADAIVGVRSVPVDEVQSSLPTLTGVRAEYLRGVTGDRLVILDAAKILAAEGLIVHDEVEE